MLQKLGFIKTNVKFQGVARVSSWRRSAFGTWGHPHDPQVYALQTIDASNLLEFLDNPNENHLSLTHIIAKAVADTISEYPQINRIIRFGRFYQRKQINIFFQVALDPSGEELTGVTLEDVDKKSLAQISLELNDKVKKIKQGDDLEFGRVKKGLKLVPTFLLPLVFKLYGLILYSLNLWPVFLGAKRDCFGTIMITNIGSLGLQTAFAPLVPYSRVPLLLSLGRVYDKAVVKNGEIVAQKSIDLCWTLDHRLIDGVIGAKMSQAIQRRLEELDWI